MSARHIPHDREPAVEQTLLQQAHEEGNRAGDGWPVPGAVLSTRDMAQLTRFAFVADVLLEMLLADVTNEAMVGGERLSNRARGALLEALVTGVGQVQAIASRMEDRDLQLARAAGGAA